MSSHTSSTTAISTPSLHDALPISLTAPPKGTTSDVMPFIVVAGVGQLGAFFCMFYGVSAMRVFTQDDAPAKIDGPLERWGLQLRRTRPPLPAIGLIAGFVALVFSGLLVILSR